MVRPPLTHLEHERGQRLGMLLREARGPRSMAEIAAVSGVPAETLRKIETGRIATPAFFTVAALADALGLPLEEIARACAEPAEASCETCPLRRPCLAGAVERSEPCVVWGGEIFEKGRVIAYKRPRGNPGRRARAS